METDVGIRYKLEIYEIVGCAFEVLNNLGCGLHEKPYENALAVELKLKGIPFEQQKKFNIHYKNHLVGEYVPDLIAYEKIVIDTKVIPKVTDLEVGQIINYLKITGLDTGLIINFKHSTLDWKRIVL